MYHKELCPFIFILGLLAFNYPIISLAEKMLPLYLYVAWGLVIMVVAIVTGLRERRRRK